MPWLFIFWCSILSLNSYGITTDNAKSKLDSNSNLNLNMEFDELIIEVPTTLYQIALTHKISIDQLAEINHLDLNQLPALNTGDKLLIPKNNTQNKNNINDKSSIQSTSLEPVLPALGEHKTEENSVIVDLISQTPVGNSLSGNSEQNTANALSDIATRDWKNTNLQTLQDETEQWAINRAKGEVNRQLNKEASEFLGKFGYAKVNISVDEKGKLKGSQFNLLSPLYEQEDQHQAHLVFGQIGLHGQGSGNDARTIGNIGLGYRYETPDWLLGGNAFIDHDFSGSNTRLGLGGEWWMDYLKLATNVYLPLSNWKASSVMEHYEKLLYDERPARGFDLRAQAYLPSYPQLGGSLTYEHYFGDEVALFSTQDRQTDPYALTLGVDYTPIPLITAKASHRLGKNNQHDTRLDLMMNLRLGTPLDAQFDPANVALARRLGGNRYDLVDRNYDIVFEYRQEAFSVQISGPSEANINDSVLFNADIQSRSPIAEYKWIVTNQLGEDRQEFTTSGQTFSFIPRQLKPYFIRLQITTERGAVGESNILRLDVGAQTTSEFTFLAGTNAFATVIPSVTSITDPEISQLPATEKLQLRFVANSSFVANNGFVTNSAQSEPASLPEMPILEWRIAGTDEFLPFDATALEAGIRVITTQDPESQNIYYFNVVADNQLLGEGSSRWIQFRAYSRTDVSVISPNYLEAEFRALEVTEFLDPNNVLIELYEVSDSEIARSVDTTLNRTLTKTPVASSGRINGENVVLNAPQNIAPSRFYEVQIKRVDPTTQNAEDVTAYFEHTIKWLYWEPLTSREVTTLVNDRRTLESCIGYPVFSTQVSNFEHNELAFGNIKTEFSEQIPSEQGLRLAVKFDFRNVQDPALAKRGSNRACYPDESTAAEPDYLGYQLVGSNVQPKAIEWRN